MFQICLAERRICIYNHYEYVEKLCSAYRISDTESPDLEIEIPDRAIEEEYLTGEGKFSRAYCESICIYRKISLELLRYHTMVLHGAVISCDKKGYVFCARSGVGKSTHIKLWQKCFSERVKIINGDKPLISWNQKEGIFTAYGTPWCGKEGWGCPESVELSAVCFLVRGEENSIRRMSPEEVIRKLFHQLLVPEDEEQLSVLMDMADAFLEKMPFFELTCNISEEAARLAFETMHNVGTL